jgi:hypothetical protein
LDTKECFNVHLHQTHVYLIKFYPKEQFVKNMKKKNLATDVETKRGARIRENVENPLFYHYFSLANAYKFRISLSLCLLWVILIESAFMEPVPLVGRLLYSAPVMVE